MLIILTGFAGSGKTSVGGILSDMLGCPFADLDALVEKAASKSIPRIFAEDGEDSFRALERSELRKVLKKYRETTAVLALGGGTVLPKGECADDTFVVWLRASIETLADRLAPVAASRPLLVGYELIPRIEELLSSRESSYEAVSDTTVDTDGLTPEQIAEDIIITAL